MANKQDWSQKWQKLQNWLKDSAAAADAVFAAVS